MGRHKFTVITVCYNAEKYIEDTICSVLSQSYDDFEYIIKDGQSTDGTMDIVRRLTDHDERVTVIQEKDQGIYDAMNVAVSLSKGDYVFFLNAGDKFANRDVLNRTAQGINNDDAGIFYGNIIEVCENESHLRIYTEKNSKMWYYSLGACLCHQGMFCKRELFREKLFDLSYKVCADRDWQMYHISRGVAARPLKFAIAEVLTEGFSSGHVRELIEEVDQCIIHYCRQWHFIYKLLLRVKKNRFLSKVIRRAEGIISCK